MSIDKVVNSLFNGDKLANDIVTDSGATSYFWNFITTSDFADILRSSSAKIIRIDNMMDKAYLKEQLLKSIE